MEKSDMQEKVEELKEQKEVLDELIKINQYKEYLKMYPINEEIQDFIKNIADKYRKKIEVKNYYNKVDGQDDIYLNHYNVLCQMKQMIRQYAIMKFGEDFLKNQY